MKPGSILCRAEQAVYVGYMSKALEGIDITDIEKHPELAERNLCLAKPGDLLFRKRNFQKPTGY